MRSLSTAAQRVTPPKSWHDPRNHFREAIKSPWYRTVVELQSTIQLLTIEYWSQRRALAMMLPVTTGSISSPMGLGSDSSPVQVTIDGVDTYLADSLQFMLEYGCRFSSSGCYYVMPSFRGEKADARHLSQFMHSEAEVIGPLDAVIDAVEEYVCFLSTGILERHADAVFDVAGTAAHLEHAATGAPFPRITFGEASIALGMDPEFVDDHGSWRTITHAGEL